MDSDLRRFSGFELNLRTSELRIGAAPVPLERQPARVLTVLVAHAGRLVTRADLCAAIWPDGTHVDFDRGLNYCLRQIRVALGDDARRPRFIETVPRQGYRFIADVACGAPASPGVGSRPEAILIPDAGLPMAPAWRRPGARMALGVAAMVLFATILEAGPGNEMHHHVAVAIARAIHDVLF